MNIALWIVAGVLAVVFVTAGLLKLTQPKVKLSENMAWVEDFSAGQVKAIGTVEILGAVGLILPGVTGIAPVLVPIAAAGLAIVMIGAAITHLRRKEAPLALANAVLFALAVFVTWGRFGPYPL